MAGLSHLRRMLVLEAEALILLDLEQTLTEAGVETVLVAATTDDALAIVDAAALDAAILDLNLGRGGWSYDVAPASAEGRSIRVFLGDQRRCRGLRRHTHGAEAVIVRPDINTLREVSSGRDVVAA